MLRLRIVKLNCNWEDEVDEYLPKEPFSKEWENDYADWEGFLRYVIPKIKQPDSMKYLLEHGSKSYLAYLIEQIALAEGWAGTIRDVAVEDHGGSLLIFYKFQKPYSTKEYWDVHNRNREYLDPNDLANQLFNDVIKFWNAPEMRMILLPDIASDLEDFTGLPRDIRDEACERVYRLLSTVTDYSLDDVKERLLDDNGDYDQLGIQMILDHVPTDDLIYMADVVIDLREHYGV